jgi:hypothetical protein
LLREGRERKTGAYRRRGNGRGRSQKRPSIQANAESMVGVSDGIHFGISVSG